MGLANAGLINTFVGSAMTASICGKALANAPWEIARSNSSPDFAHGFCSLQPDAADADTLSAKDRKQPLLADLPAYFTWSE